MGGRHRSILWEPDRLGGLQEEEAEEHMGGRVGSGRLLHVAETMWVRAWRLEQCCQSRRCC